MTAFIKVWPTKETAVDLKHPAGAKLSIDGVDWPQDSFTARRLRDGSATQEADKALKPESKKDEAAEETSPKPFLKSDTPKP